VVLGYPEPERAEDEAAGGDNEQQADARGHGRIVVFLP
jgi:hypothetical protein